MQGTVTAVARSGEHHFSKVPVASVELVAHLGVAQDAHAGVTVQHRSRVAVNPDQPNLRQVHLMHAELFDELDERGFTVRPGDLGENITTRGLDLLALPRGTRLQLGASAVVEVTGLRNPCGQIEAFQPGLLAAVLEQAPDGRWIRKAGIMGVVCAGGTVAPGDAVQVTLPPEPWVPLERV
ncbi:MOSC domain-containing protein [Deinococcus sonorensis]|uniref:MOSC domain-containing protein n=1 Tax=Deinococcus sonorensis TaxID=309891 RepID=A0ABV8Y493_9DEIO